MGLPEYGEGHCSRSTLPRKYCHSSAAKGVSTTSLMRIMALLGDRVGGPLHTDRGEVDISQVFMIISYMEILRFKVLVGARGKSGI